MPLEKPVTVDRDGKQADHSAVRRHRQFRRQSLALQRMSDVRVARSDERIRSHSTTTGRQLILQARRDPWRRLRAGAERAGQSGNFIDTRLIAKATSVTCASATNDKAATRRPVIDPVVCHGKNLERAKGLEPSTPTLARSCSTTELHPHPRWRRTLAVNGRPMPNADRDCNSPRAVRCRADNPISLTNGSESVRNNA